MIFLIWDHGLYGVTCNCDIIISVRRKTRHSLTKQSQLVVLLRLPHWTINTCSLSVSVNCYNFWKIDSKMLRRLWQPLSFKWRRFGHLNCNTLHRNKASRSHKNVLRMSASVSLLPRNFPFGFTVFFLSFILWQAWKSLGSQFLQISKDLRTVIEVLLCWKI